MALEICDWCHGSGTVNPGREKPISSFRYHTAIHALKAIRQRDEVLGYCIMSKEHWDVVIKDVDVVEEGKTSHGH